MAPELLDPWHQDEGDGPWWASFQTAGPVLLLTAYKGPDGLWRAVVEMKNLFGPDWKSPSPFASAELARQWAESQAEKLRDWR
jgi:hypothetical protein